MFWEELYIRFKNLDYLMYQLFYKYLILHKEANLPGLGTFYMERSPAKLDFGNKVIAPPAFEIGFNPAASVADQSFYSYLSTEQKIEEAEAIKNFGDFSYSVRKELDQNKFLELPRIGQMIINEDGVLQFKSLKQLHNFFPAVSTEIVTKPYVEEIISDNVVVGNPVTETVVTTETVPVVKKDYWWIFAVILAVIAIGAICYYYYLNGSLE